jgi:glycine/D-amino acid oxidase-like deaminating enzyme
LCAQWLHWHGWDGKTHKDHLVTPPAPLVQAASPVTALQQTDVHPACGPYLGFCMKIASVLPLASADLTALRPAVIAVLPDLKQLNEAAMAEVLIDGQFDVLISDCTPAGLTLRRWSAARGREVFVLIRQTLGPARCFVSRCEGAVQVFFSQTDMPIAQPFGMIERLYSREVTARDTIALISDRLGKRGSETALVVGAGIVGLMTALTLVKAGYEVEVIDACADPRQGPMWHSLGCTHGGANARMFSLTECDNYHDRDALPGALLHDYLRQRVSDMGWLIGRPDDYTAEDVNWIQQSLAMPVWLADQYNDDIFALSHESLEYWRDLMTANPGLFDGVEYCEPLLRVASSAEYNAKQLKRQLRVGSYLTDLDPAQVVDRYPSLAAGVASGDIAGGIEVTGFTVNVHDFTERLLGHLEGLGVRFHWQTAADRIMRQDGTVTGIGVKDAVLRADHYILSTGVYGGDLLKGTASEGKVHGVLGAWMTIPNLEPCLTVALKIARLGHIAGSGNIIPARDAQGRPILIFGSGFGYVGHNPANIDPEEIEALYASMEDYLAAMFPAAFNQALADGSLRQSRKYCVRPWTASSLGTFEVMPAQSGLMVIASGHNTGGFAQSPAVGRATLDALQGRLHPMHTLYHPNRYDAFWLGHKTAARTDAAPLTDARAPLTVT